MRFITYVILTVLFLTACSEVSEPTGESSEKTSNNVVELESGLFESDSLFAKDSILTFNFTLDSADLAFLDSDPALEEYVPANVQILGRNLDSVGLRYKGSAGSLRLCLDENNNLICSKLSLKVKFSEYKKDQRLLGLKKVNLHAMNRDATKLKEQLAYDLYRKEGIPAPRTSWAKVVINGKDQGYYSLIEQIDGRFTKFNFPDDGDGNLYKEAYPNHQDAAIYKNAQKTNEELPSATRLLEFQSAIMQATQKGDLDEYIDMVQWVKYLAIDRAITNWDGITTFYCDDNGSCSSHNFYLYLNQDVVTPVIWDLDGTWGVEALWTGLWAWDEEPENCDVKLFNGTASLRAAQCDPFMKYTKTFYHQEYLDALKEVRDNYFTNGYLLTELEKWRNYLAPKISEEISLSTWNSSVDVLKSSIEVLTQKIKLESQGKAWKAFQFNPKEPLTFENYSGVELSAQMTANSSPNSFIAIDKDENDRMIVRYSAENEVVGAWGTWMSVLLPLNEVQDLSQYNAIKITAQGSVSMMWNISLASPDYTDPNVGEFFTKEMFVAESSENAVILNFADFQMASWGTKNIDDSFDEIIKSISSVVINPTFRTRQGTGLFPEGSQEIGEVYIKEIEFLSI